MYVIDNKLYYILYQRGSLACLLCGDEADILEDLLYGRCYSYSSVVRRNELCLSFLGLI